MGKKRKAKTLDAWCWYCDREFEDDKVLLQHQKAKHYKCPYCPRRLNTAGGLTVHLHQVHKAEPTIIDNALPGRESFSIEIYGMVGVPEADLAEWRARKRGTRGGGLGGGPGDQPGNKRPAIEKMVYTKAQLKAQLEAHKALMSGRAPPPGSMPPGFLQPPPGYASGPPPAFSVSVPPPPIGVPPPLYAANGSAPYAGPPPGLAGAGRADAQGANRSTSTSAYKYPAPTFPSVNAHEEAVKAGAKSRMVYTDTFVSPEEKLASTSKYRYVDAEDQESKQNAASSSSQVQPNFSLPPPGYGQQQAQSYPAVDAQSHGEPASANPFANTAESLAASNAHAASGDVARQREIDMQGAEAQAQKAFASGPGAQQPAVGITEAADAGSSSPHPSAGRQGRARAADLF